MINILLIYITCNNIFRNHLNLIYHIKYNYQLLIKVKFQNEDMIKIKKKENNIFKYIYEKRFKILILL